MRIKELIKDIEVVDLFGSSDPEIQGLALDSRKVGEGYLFAAMKGTQSDGHKYIREAVNSGACAVLCEELPPEIPESVVFVKVSNVSSALGKVCSTFFNHPSKNLHIIGITGTNGKTSIATWLYELGKKLGYPCGLISTIRIMIKDDSYPASHTTPDIVSLYYSLQLMVETGCQYVFMEVSSHALDQNRVAGLDFTGAVFTNLTRDHLDYHKDFISYLKSKKILFDRLENHAFALVNRDDKNAEVMLQNSSARPRKYSTTSIADYHGKLLEQIQQAMLIELNGKELWVPFIGKFNASNITAVYGVARELGWKDDEVLSSLSSLRQVEGRFEMIDLGNGITGIVDYAHTPDALTNVLGAVRDLCHGKSRIITVVGAGGDRDKGKRPKMTSAACQESDIVILTSDNPRSEKAEAIIDDMQKGIPHSMASKVFSIASRREAIKVAVSMSFPGDYILVAGKGHENYQEIDGIRYHFDDREELIKMKESLTANRR